MNGIAIFIRHVVVLGMLNIRKISYLPNLLNAGSLDTFFESQPFKRAVRHAIAQEDQDMAQILLNTGRHVLIIKDKDFKKQ
jgi:hypothetical protein